MPTARVAFAGLSPLSEDILRAALARRPDIELVTPWTRLSSLARSQELPEMLLLELDGSTLPAALRAMLSAAPQLRIIALSPDARSATLFFVAEQRTVIFGYSAESLCSVLDPIHFH